jgi:hypothetical protein
MARGDYLRKLAQRNIEIGIKTQRSGAPSLLFTGLSAPNIANFKTAATPSTTRSFTLAALVDTTRVHVKLGFYAPQAERALMTFAHCPRGTRPAPTPQAAAKVNNYALDLV